MEMFAVGAYLQLVEGCDSVTYHSELPNKKEFWLEVVGRSEAKQAVFYVDFPRKFDWYPLDMRPDTMVRKLVSRYVEVVKEGLALDYEPHRIHCQLWMPRPPARRVADALPKVRQRLTERHDIELELIEPDEVARRIPLAVERVRKQSFDYDNLFIRSLLIAQGRLDYQTGAPMAQEQIEAMYRFPCALRSADELPAFVYHFLCSREVVNWLDFDSPTFDEMASWLAEAGPGAGLGELQEALAQRGEVVDEEEDYEFDETAHRTRRYSARDLAELTRLVLAHIEALWPAASQHSLYGPLHIEIDFMLPFLSRVQEWLDPSQIERQILRYGGSRDQMLVHFANRYPDKRPYRAILRIEFFEPGGERLPAYPGGKSMEVRIRDPAVADDIEVAVTINYLADFAGYFVMMMHRLAANLGS
jgi:hypothetical protein